MTYTAHSYGVDTINKLVGEMHPLAFDNILGKIGFISLGLSILMYGKEKFPMRWVLLFLGMTILMLSSIRSISLFLTIGLMPAAYFFRHCQRISNRTIDDITVNKRFCIVMMILILITYGYGLHQSKDTMFHFLANVPLLIKTTISL